jgi:hypothetical protein
MSWVMGNPLPSHGQFLVPALEVELEEMLEEKELQEEMLEEEELQVEEF